MLLRNEYKSPHILNLRAFFMAVNLTDLGQLRDLRFNTAGIVRLSHFPRIVDFQPGSCIVPTVRRMLSP